MKLVLIARLDDDSMCCSDIFYGFDDLDDFRYMIEHDLDYRIDGKKIMSYDIFGCIDGTFFYVNELPF